MVNPREITNFNRSQAELEEFLLFCIIVAGKTAAIQANKLEEFLSNSKFNLRPFQLIEYYINNERLSSEIKNVKLGQYNRLEKAFAQVLNLDVFNCTVADLEKITGIGPKTARFFILHSRPNQKVAVLDVHILKWLREELNLNSPKATPNSKQYLILEQEFLNYCENTNKNPAVLDLEIWNKYSLKNKK